MKMRLRSLRIGLFVVLLGLAGGAQAANQYFQSTVQAVYPLADGTFVLIFAQSSPSCHSPNSPQYFYITTNQNGVTADGVKAMLATALAAFAMGKTLAIAFDDSTQYCYINRFSMQ
jgi:hypothetical protein